MIIINVYRQAKYLIYTKKVKNRDVNYAIIKKENGSLKIPETSKVIFEEIHEIDNGTNIVAACKRYYDSVFDKSSEYQKDPKHLIYLPVWEAVKKKLVDRKLNSEVEIGCGPNQFSSYICTELPKINYTGIDFNGTAIKMTICKNAKQNNVLSGKGASE